MVPSSMRTVMLSCPSYDGKVSVWHASTLAESSKLALSQGINIVAVYMSYDALVQRARNDIVKLAIDAKVDDLVFVDADTDWSPPDLLKLLSHDVSVVGAPVPKKAFVEQYNVRLLGDYVVGDDGLVEVDGVGTGFLRVRADALAKIWAASAEYREPHKSEPSRMVFEVRVVDGVLQSEDLAFCERLKTLGEHIYVDPTIDAGHVGEHRWIGNFAAWIEQATKKG